MFDDFYKSFITVTLLLPWKNCSPSVQVSLTSPEAGTRIVNDKGVLKNAELEVKADCAT
jgi:hypothetical protein